MGIAMFMIGLIVGIILTIVLTLVIAGHRDK